MSSLEPKLMQASLSDSAATVGAVRASEGAGGITLLLVAANVLMFILMAIFGVGFFSASTEGVLKWGANYGPLTLGGQWWRMFTSLFLHFGVIHLVFNMVVLADIGIFMETLMGSLPFVALYVVAGLGGGAASMVWHPTTVSAGASGAIFGLYGGLLAFFLRHGNEISSKNLASLKKGAIVFVGYNVLYGMFNPEIDMAAHLGGLATGFIVGLFLVRRGSQASGGRSVASVVLGAATQVEGQPTEGPAIHGYARQRSVTKLARRASGAVEAERVAEGPSAVGGGAGALHGSARRKLDAAGGRSAHRRRGQDQEIGREKHGG